MNTEIYDDLEWEIDRIPVGSSTPDDLFELTYNANANCPNCGSEIQGEANYWSNYNDMSNAWLSSVYYVPCDCKE